MPAFIPASLADATSNHRSRQRTQKGAAAVEFALLLPILLFVFFGIVELSLALYDKAILTNASREGARAGIVLSSPKVTDSQIRNVVLAYTQGALLSMGASPAPTVSIVRSATNEFPDVLNVTVSYTYSGLGLGKMLSALSQPLVLSSSTVMVNE